MITRIQRFIYVYLSCSEDYLHALSLFAAHAREQRRAREMWELHHNGWLS